LKNATYESQDMTIFSETDIPVLTSFVIERNEVEKYTLNMIDTPGLKEVKKIGEFQRDDDVILDTIGHCLKSEITKINVVLIFISFEVGVTNDDMECFRKYESLFGNDDVQVGIVITRMENKNESYKKKIEGQLKNANYFSDLLKKPNVSLHFSGNFIIFIFKVNNIKF
jgi:predicted GTPase